VCDLGSFFVRPAEVTNDDDFAATYVDQYLIALNLARLLDKGAANPANLNGFTVPKVWEVILAVIKRFTDARRPVDLFILRYTVLKELGMHTIMPCNSKKDSSERVDGAYGAYLVGALCCYAMDDPRDEERHIHPPVVDPTHAKDAAVAAAAAQRISPEEAEAAAIDEMGGAGNVEALLAGLEAFGEQVDRNFRAGLDA